MFALIIFLDVLHGKSFGYSAMPTLEDDIGDTIHEAVVWKMKEGLQEEIWLTLEYHHKKWEKRRVLSHSPIISG